MQSTRSSLSAVLRSGVAALTVLPMITTTSLAGVMTNHGEKIIKSRGAPPSQVALQAVRTPSGSNDNNTTTPIKHVIIIVGENRSFDHLYATYVSPSGDSVKNLLSEGIVNADGTPGPNFSKAKQMKASDTTTFSISPTITGPYKKLPPPNLAFTPETTSYAGPPWVSTKVAAQYDYGLLKQDLPAATKGASGLPQRTIDTRISECLSAAGRSVSAVARRGFWRLRRQSGASLLPDVPAARLQRVLRHNGKSKRLPRGSVPLGRGDGRGGHQRQSPAGRISTTRRRWKAPRRWASTTFSKATRPTSSSSPTSTRCSTIITSRPRAARVSTASISAYADDLWYSDGKGQRHDAAGKPDRKPRPASGHQQLVHPGRLFGRHVQQCADSNQKGVASVNAYLSALQRESELRSGALLSSEQL